ncbi:transketolase [Dehalococcoidia bacterium]|nr:transketolase [Dehalococcoidia bacterium]
MGTAYNSRHMATLCSAQIPSLRSGTSYVRKTIDELCINTIRFLAIDAVQRANSGHPGAPMGMAPMAYVLWDRFLKHNPADPKWPNRDRFILSAGHASAMLYALLYLTGYELSLEEIKHFRQWESKTPGHPEYGLTPGVEATTGPLGQGFANGVGMAIAEKMMAQHYNRPGYEIIDHYTYAIVSDGDLMEGVASEAASLAGTLRLGKLIYLYDDNDISIEGHTDITFREDVGKRFEAYGWHVVGPIDGTDLDAIDDAIRQAQAERDRPSLIICKTIIGYGSPSKANTASAHGEPLGEAEVLLTRENLAWPFREPFTVPPDVLVHFRQARERGKRWQQDWESKLEAYRREFPEAARRLGEDLAGNLPDGWEQDLDDLFSSQEKPISTRAASGLIINAIGSKVHSLTGGSADLAPSTKTIMRDRGHYGPENYAGHNIHFGVREHAMGAIANGMALHGGVIPYTATFLVFYDYMRPPVRLAAMMGLQVIYIFTHDSIGVGEDGPTHQPIEQLIGLRSVPNLVTLRPADATETAEAWKMALRRRHGPTALVLSRQDLPFLDRSILASASGVQRGGYVLWEASTSPEVILIGTGSEVHIALEAGRILQEKGVPARVVSLPSWELFDAQPAEYRNQILPPEIRARISIEAGTPRGWERYIGLDGLAMGVSCFGSSAPAGTIYERLGLTAKAVVDKALALLGGRD